MKAKEKRMTKALEEELKKFYESDKCRTDSNVEDFCDEHNLPYGEAFHLISKWSAPECCRTCKYVSFYCSMYPCTECSRPKKDMYKAEE